jgi:hypothetical protein
VLQSRYPPHGNVKDNVISVIPVCDNINKHKCIYCDKTFTNRHNKCRHQNKYCPYRPVSTKSSEKSTEVPTNLKSDSNNCDSFKNHIIIPQEINNTNNNTNNNIDNSDNSSIDNSSTTNSIDNSITNIDNHKDIQINLNYYGNETSDHLTKEFYLRILKEPSTCSRKIINKIHFNKERPNNGHMRITNKQLKYAEVFTNEGWKVKSKKSLCGELILKSDVRIDEFVEKNRKEIPKTDAETFDRYVNRNRIYEFVGNVNKVELDLINWTRYMQSIKHIQK